MSQTVDRALRILEFLSEGERSLADVAEMLDVHKSTALRLLQTLESHGYARHDASHRYRLGSRLFKLAATALGSRDIRMIAAPHIRHLGEQTQQTIHLAAFEDREVFYIDKYETQKTVRMYSRVGATAPLYCTAVAKAIVAQLPAKERADIARSIHFVRHTERTITTLEHYLRELTRTKERGYAVDDREHEDYIHCVGVPLQTGTGRVTHSISLSATTMTLSRERLLELVPLVQDTAAAINNEIN